MNSHTTVNPSQKKQDFLVPLRKEQKSLTILPDEMLVRIGISVAKLCGIQEFISFSQVSKRMKRLLMDSEATLSNVIRVRIRQSTVPLSSVDAAAIRNLPQLAFFESLVQHNIFQENRVHFEFADLQIADSDSIALVKAVRSILSKYPFASVILEAHCGTPAPTEVAWLYSHYRGKVVRTAIVSGTGSLDEDDNDEAVEDPQLRGRVGIRAWGKMVTEIVSQSQHPYRELARQGRGWVEVYMRIESSISSTERILEFPPRPDFYSQTPNTPREYTSDEHQERTTGRGDSWIQLY